MSIALERIPCIPVYETPAALAMAEDEDVASCSSSIGRNSDCDGRSDDGDEAEVQSSYKGPLDTMDALEDSLPTRRGISTFYYGKSKSFTNLTDALPSSSSKNLAKPENSYSRKRKKLLAFNLWEKPNNRNSQRSNKDITVSKRPANFSRSKEGLGPSTSSSSESNSCSNGHHEATACVSASNSKKWFSNPLRSFSFADLQGVLCSRTYVKSGDKQSRFR